MSKYLLTGKYSKCTLFGIMLDMGLSPLLSAFLTFKYTQKYSARDGVVDSLQGVLEDVLPRIKTTALKVSYFIALCICGIFCLGISVRQAVYFLSKKHVNDLYFSILCNFNINERYTWSLVYMYLWFLSLIVF